MEITIFNLYVADSLRLHSKKKKKIHIYISIFITKVYAVPDIEEVISIILDVSRYLQLCDEWIKAIRFHAPADKQQRNTLARRDVNKRNRRKSGNLKINPAPGFGSRWKEIGVSSSAGLKLESATRCTSRDGGINNKGPNKVDVGVTVILIADV